MSTQNLCHRKLSEFKAEGIYEKLKILAKNYCNKRQPNGNYKTKKYNNWKKKT